MSLTWLPWAVLAVVAASIFYELGTGTARLRGFGSYSRAERPRAYWTAILLKGILAALITAVAVVSRA